jgi:hypothetical protein
MNAQQPSSGTQPDLVRDVVHDLVAEFAPDEMPILDAMADSSDAEALSRLRRHSRRREPLGFGIGDLLPVLTPILWIALTAALETVAGDTTRVLLRKAFRKLKPKEPVPALTSEELDEVCDKVRAALVQKGVDEGRADKIVAALRARLKRGPGQDAVEG